MGAPVKYRGDVIEGRFQLRLTSQSNPLVQLPYVLPVSRLIELRFPGGTAAAPVSVVLSTLTAGEITIDDANAATISFKMPAAKSLLLQVTKNAAVDCVVTDTGPTPNEPLTFEKVKVYAFQDRANN